MKPHGAHGTFPGLVGWLGLVTLLLVPGLLGAAPPHGSPAATGAGCTPGSGLTLNATPSTGSSPMTVQFTISDPHGPPTWVNWSFGDGSPPANGQGDPYLSTSHRYTSWGLFEAVVNVTQGAQSLLCAAAIEVNPPAFSIAVHATPVTGVAPLTVRFSVNLTGGTDAYSNAGWTFGDGSSATGFDVNYTYAAPGNYTATLTVIDSANQTAVDSVRILVNASTPLNRSDGSGNGNGFPTWVLAVVAGTALLLALGLAFWWRLGSRGSGAGPGSTSPRTAVAPVAPDEFPTIPEPVAPEVLGGPPPTFVEEVPVRPRTVAVGSVAGVKAALAAAPLGEASDESEAAPAVDPSLNDPSTDSGPRLKLSQRVMLHLYLQGHLADGEVAPFGFTQGGMAEKLQIAQSPLSSVLRRLVVAGLVNQDTRHVRGQPRRLRVYRLTSVGEVVARDLYRQSVEGAGGSHRDD